jgi:hypothetical protein
MRRARRGIATAEMSGETDVTMNYQGLDNTPRRTMLRFEPAPERLSTSAAAYRFDLQPKEFRSIYVTAKSSVGQSEPRWLPFRKGLRAAFKENRTASQGKATIATSNPIFNEVVCRSMADLAILSTETPQGPYP